MCQNYLRSLNKHQKVTFSFIGHTTMEEPTKYMANFAKKIACTEETTCCKETTRVSM